MYIPSKILLKNEQILLVEHKCQTCDDILAVFKPYKVASNAECQKTWYQENAENVLSMINIIIQSLNIKSHIKGQDRNTICPRKM